MKKVNCWIKNSLAIEKKIEKVLDQNKENCEVEIGEIKAKK